MADLHTSMFNEIMEQPTVLKSCLENNVQTISKIVSDMNGELPEFITIAARGTSDHAAIYAKYMFEALTGIPVSLSAPSIITSYKANLNLKNSLVIGVSQSGAAKDVAAVMENANRSGAVTVAITNFGDSLLAKNSKYTLLCSAGIEHSVAATKTFTTQLLLLGMLAAKLGKNKVVEEELMNVPELVFAALTAVDKQTEDAAVRYRFIDECIVLARGMNYSIALESALKIEETTYVRAKAFATSDFHHGPMAVLQKDLPVIIYASSGPTFSDMREMISILKDSGADILIVSDDEELRNDADCFIKTPRASSSFVSPFVNAVVAQLFACYLAHNKGLNPDKPRMLHKITVTV